MDIYKKFENLVVIEKIYFAERYPNYLRENIKKYIELVGEDDIYFYLTRDEIIQEVLKKYRSIRWDKFRFLNEMTIQNSDGFQDHKSYKKLLPEILFDIAIDYSNWFNRIILNEKKGDKLKFSHVGLNFMDLEEYFANPE